MTRARDVANLIGSGNYSSTTFTATAGQTVFSIAHTQNFVQVFMNGLLLDLTVDYTSNGSAVTLTSGAAAGDEIEVVAYNTFSVGDALNQAAADTRYVNTTGDTMTGALTVDAAGATVLTLDRATSDGTVIDVQKNGASVGTIGTAGNQSYIHGAGTDVGLYWGSNNLYPYRSTGLNDATIDIGQSGKRFKDLYLSGGAYIGGTGAANKLEDYEEGTWTPVHDNTFTEGCWQNSSSMSGNGKYTKVGNMVTCWWDGSVSGGSGSITVSSNYSVTYSSLPFTPASSGSGVHKLLSGYQMIYSAVGSGHIGHGSITPLHTQSVFVVTTTAVSHSAMSHSSAQTLMVQFRV